MSRPAKLVAVAVVLAVLPSAPAAADPTVQTLEPSRPSTPALDEQFLADLARAGMGVTDVPRAVFGAHDTCAFLAAGHDAEEAVEKGMANNASMTRADEIAYIDAVIEVYCPRYPGITGTLT
jgi:Protein of unknown function (DUF732)